MCDHVNISELVKRTLRREDVKKTNNLSREKILIGLQENGSRVFKHHTYIFMVHVLEHAELSVGPLGVNGGLEGPGDLLDGDPEELAVRSLH